MSRWEKSCNPFSNTVTPFYLKETAWMFELLRNWLSPFFSLFPLAALLCHFWSILDKKKEEKGRSRSLTKWDRIAAILSSPPLVKLKNKVEIELMLAQEASAVQAEKAGRGILLFFIEKPL